MKNLTLLVWLTQLGLSVALPLACGVGLGIWLRNTWGWGPWVIWAGIILGVLGAADGLRVSLKTMERLSKSKEEKEPPPVSFNTHD